TGREDRHPSRATACAQGRRRCRRPRRREVIYAARVSWSRREVLASLGVASAQTILWACGAPRQSVRRKPTDVNPEIRTYLHDAVARLRGAGFAAAHVLAVSRHRMTAAIDVLGAGVARGNCDGVVLSVRDRDGMTREHVTNDLSQRGIAAAVKVLAGD